MNHQYLLLLIITIVGSSLAQPKLVNITLPFLYPEGIEWSPTINRNFYISSTSFGTIYRVNDDASFAPFVQDTRLISTLGLKIEGSVLLICNTNFSKVASGETGGFQSSLVYADADTGVIQRVVDLSYVGPNNTSRLANDVVVVNDVAYITDSIGGQIWKVDAEFNVTTFVSSPLWSNKSSLVGLNGIDVTPDLSALIVCKSDDGKLYRVLIGNRSISEIQIRGPTLLGADGLRFAQTGELFVVGRLNTFVLASTDGWASAFVTRQYVSPIEGQTTIAFRDTIPYILHSHFALSNEDNFEIERVNFADVSLITLNISNLQSEGIDYSVNTGFLVSSLAQGTIIQVGDEFALRSPFIQSTQLIATAGLEIDEARNLLYVANVNLSAVFSGITTGFLSSLVVVDMSTRQIIYNIDVSNVGTANVSHLINGIAVSSNGNVYATDSFGAQIWVFSGTSFTPSQYVYDARWVGEPEVNGIGINGLVYSETNNILLACKSGSGRLFTITLDSSRTVNEVRLNQNLTGCDGLALKIDGTLIAVGNTVQKVYHLVSNDNWVTATVVSVGSTPYGEPSSAVVRDNEVYLIHSHLFGPSPVYEIDKVIIPTPDVIFINRTALLPEGIAYHPLHNFLVSSLSFGTIFKVNDLGVLTPLVEDPGLYSTLGIAVDNQRNRLYIANVNQTAVFSRQTTGFMSNLVIASLDTGFVLGTVGLSNIGTQGVTHFANDIAIDEDGNIYVTDTFGAQIWKIVGDEPFSFVNDSRWGFNNTFGLNGIVYQNQYLLTADTTSGILYKVSTLNGSISVVTTNMPLYGADGMLFDNDGNLIVVGNGNTFQKFYKVSSTNDFQTATVVATVNSNYVVPTTAALRGDEIFVCHGHFFETNPSIFEIEKVNFNPSLTTGQVTSASPPMTTTTMSMSSSTGTTSEPVNESSKVITSIMITLVIVIALLM